MLKKIKIKIKDVELTRVVFWGKPLFEYGIENNQKFLKRLFLKKIVQEKNEDIFYLKVNNYDLFFLQHWVDIIPNNSKIFIVVDNNSIKKEIIKNITFKNTKVYFIKSHKSLIFRRWFKKIKLRKKWLNVGMAHLTTFWHSQSHRFEDFWNIDADDTLMCIDAEKAKTLFSEVKKYAQENEIDIFSQDFYYSREPEYPHWSFGVSYTRNKFKLKDFISFDYKTWVNDFYWKGTMNLDCYFNYLKDYIPNLNLKVFSPKNLLFLHYNSIWTLKVGAASFMQYTEDKIEYPLIQSFYNNDEIGIGYVPRNKNTILIDAKINKKEGSTWFYENFILRDNYDYWMRTINKKANAEVS